MPTPSARPRRVGRGSPRSSQFDAVDQSTTDRLGDVRPLCNRAREPEQADDEGRPHRRDNRRPDSRGKRRRPAGAGADHPGHEQASDAGDQKDGQRFQEHDVG